MPIPTKSLALSLRLSALVRRCQYLLLYAYTPEVSKLEKGRQEKTRDLTRELFLKSFRLWGDRPLSFTGPEHLPFFFNPINAVLSHILVFFSSHRVTPSCHLDSFPAHSTIPFYQSCRSFCLYFLSLFFQYCATWTWDNWCWWGLPGRVAKCFRSLNNTYGCEKGPIEHEWSLEIAPVNGL